MSWIPHITVAAVIERDSKFLVVEEKVKERTVYNQPAGHLEENESLTEAVVRETLEETGYRFSPGYVSGIYHWQQANSRETYIRIAFSGNLVNQDVAAVRDKNVIAVVWLDVETVRALPASRQRSPMLLRCIEDYLAGRRYPLSLLSYIDDRRTR